MQKVFIAYKFNMSRSIYLLHVLSNASLIKHCTQTQKIHRKVKNAKCFRHSGKTEVVEVIHQQAKKFAVDSIFTSQKAWYETHRNTLFAMGLEKKKLLQVEKHRCLSIFEEFIESLKLFWSEILDYGYPHVRHDFVTKPH